MYHGVMAVPVTIEVSARHVHLTAPTLERLFGPGVSLTPDRPLSQTGQFAARERVTLAGPRGQLTGVRIVGPLRAHEQVELAVTDARLLGLDPPLRASGNLAGAAPITLVGPADRVVLPGAAIIQERHLHAAPADAARLGLKDGQRIPVRVAGPRGGTLKHVRVRIDPSFQLRLHLDTDEANALDIATGATGTLLL